MNMVARTHSMCPCKYMSNNNVAQKPKLPRHNKLLDCRLLMNVAVVHDNNGHQEIRKALIYPGRVDHVVAA